MGALYNEIDPYAAAWLGNLAAAGHIAPGRIDARSILDLRPADLEGVGQFHAFAGIAGWSLALRLAGVPDHAPVWTGSCPCQPFSAAGRRGGFDDARHLWPVWFDLIRQCRPAIVFGEQVEAAVRLGWLDAVFSDLEGEGYACAATVLGAHSVGAPHIRQRLWFVAYSSDERRDGQPALLRRPGPAGRVETDRPEANGRGPTGFLGDAERLGLRGQGCGPDVGAPGGVPGPNGEWQRLRHEPRPAGGTGSGLGDAGVSGLSARERQELCGPRRREEGRSVQQSGRPFWADVDWIACRDGKARPVEPGTFPLAPGLPGRVGRLRAYGNAIVPQAAAAFIADAMDALSPIAAEA